jgi:hypothetical protein
MRAPHFKQRQMEIDFLLITLGIFIVIDPVIENTVLKTRGFRIIDKFVSESNQGSWHGFDYFEKGQHRSTQQ